MMNVGESVEAAAVSISLSIRGADKIEPGMIHSTDELIRKTNSQFGLVEIYRLFVTTSSL